MFNNKKIYHSHTGYCPTYDSNLKKYVTGFFIKSINKRTIKMGEEGILKLLYIHHKYDEEGNEYPNYEHETEIIDEFKVRVTDASADGKFFVFVAKDVKKRSLCDEERRISLRELNKWR